MNYETFFADRLKDLHAGGNYRVFADLERVVGAFPQARIHDSNGSIRDVTLWCSNDYLGLGMQRSVLDAMKTTLEDYGAGAGGTRNISGTTPYHVLLERELASWHDKEAALLFTSGYVANMTTLWTLGANIPGLVFFSDELNHNSMIEGMRHARADKEIWKHNDSDDLHKRLSRYDRNTPKMVVFESVYSMDGDIAPLEKIIDVAEHHNAMTYLDEVHAVGMYGAHGSGIAERDGMGARITLVQGTLGKAVGVIGGYIAASATLIDFVRSYGAGFIFTTSLPPAIAAGALASVRYLREHNDLRLRHQNRAATLKSRLRTLGLPVLPSVSHIVPVHVGDAFRCKQASDELLNLHHIYVQPINHPTVPLGTERLRLTPTPLHDDSAMDHLCDAMVAVWDRLGLKRNVSKTRS